MAVYERKYRRYAGALTPTWSRFLVLPRYAYRELFRSRLFLIAFIAAYLLPLVGTVIIYVSHNLKLLEYFGAQTGQDLVPLDGVATVFFLNIQGLFAFFLTFLVGPRLISRDLNNNALPLYLARPFDRAEYVLGKFSVLAILLSAVTWVPGLFLFLLHGILHEGWMWSNLHLGAAILVGSVIWILILSLLVLAVSAYVRKAMLARGALLVLFIVFFGFGNFINEVFNTEVGSFLSLINLIEATWTGLCGIDTPFGLSAAQAGTALIVLAGLCLWVLSRKVKAYEVVT